MRSKLSLLLFLFGWISCSGTSNLHAQSRTATAIQTNRSAQAQSFQEPGLRVISETRTGIVVEITASWVAELPSAFEKYTPPDVVPDYIGDAVRGHRSMSHLLELPALAEPVVRVQSASFDEYNLPDASDRAHEILSETLSSMPADVIGIGYHRRRPVGTLDVRLMTYDPQVRTVRRYRRMLIEVLYQNRPDAQVAKRVGAAVQTDNPHLAVTRSVLAEGTWYKIPISETGIYRIDRDYLTALGLAPNSIDPEAVQIFGNGGQPLPALNSLPRIADLAENPVHVTGGGDGSFDAGDRVLFYARGSRGWQYDAGDGQWEHYINPFSNFNYYFLRIDGSSGQRVGTPAFPNDPNATLLATFEARLFTENDRLIIEQDGSGSGLDWLGELVDTEVSSRTILDQSPPGLQAGTVTYRSRVATQSNPAATLHFVADGATLQSARPGTVSLGAGSELGYSARDAVVTFDQTVSTGDRLLMELQLEGTINDPKGWLDWIEVFYPSSFEAVNDRLYFSTPVGRDGRFEMVLSGFSAEPHVWDITSPTAVRRVGVQAAGGTYRVQVEVTDATQPRDLVAFVPNTAAVQSPEAGELVANQNLHGLPDYPDFVIITPDVLRGPAEELAEIRRQEGLVVYVADIQQVYNEFSGGVPDMRAVRDYFKFLYDRSLNQSEDQWLRYGLLFGDGHYDFRELTQDESSPLNPNWIFPFETDETLLRRASYTSDDYFGLLDDNEGIWEWTSEQGITFERVDIGVGRIPVLSLDQAQTVVDKIKHYESPETRGPWRTRYTFVADDDLAGTSNDRDLHTQNADVVAEDVVRRYPEINLSKVYAISFPKETTAGGRRIPEAKRELLRLIDEDGTLLWNYSGHGGVSGLADERLLTLEDIAELTNRDKLPIFVTATCSFGKFDLERGFSGAEELLAMPEGGAIALLTTVRLVVTWSNPNTYNLGLNLELNRQLFTRDEDGLPRRLGDVMRLTKNSNVGLQGNNRKFNLLGDPTMRLGLPRRQVEVVQINGNPVSAQTPVPLRALERIEIDGQVVGMAGTADPAFNGTVEVTVFDAKRDIEIPEESRLHIPSGTYSVQNDLIYRGKVRVQSGRFKVTFVVPKDIAYTNEAGRIALYSRSDTEDGIGATEHVTVGGTAPDPVQDEEGPRIELYLEDDPNFISGGLTHSIPSLTVKLFDDTGINTVGTGVGHEMLLVLDGDEQNALEIGGRFEGDLDSFQEGTVVVELPEQTPGPHTVQVKAWDVINNSSSEILDFVVVPETELVLRNVFNYPNPTLGAGTAFFFEHNQPTGTPAEVEIRVYTVSGRLIQVLEGFDTLPEGVLPGGPVRVEWDGRDQDMDALASGVYLYKVRVDIQNDGGDAQVAEHIGRLAVLR